MKRLLKSISIAIAICAGVLFVPTATHAVDVISPVCDNTNGINQSSVCKDDLTKSDDNPLYGPNGALTKSINVISIVVAVVATIVIIIAAIRLMVSQGNPQTISSARNQIIYAAVGIAVAALAQGIVTLVLKKL